MIVFRTDRSRIDLAFYRRLAGSATEHEDSHQKCNQTSPHDEARDEASRRPFESGGKRISTGVLQSDRAFGLAGGRLRLGHGETPISVADSFA